MAELSAWLAVAGLGALHGLSPATGWMFAAARGVRARDGGQARRALLPIGIGHAVSVVVVACSVALGMSMDRALFQHVAGALLVVAALYRLLRGARHHAPTSPSSRQGCHGGDCTASGEYRKAHAEGFRIRTRAGHAGIALWSFMMATAHGAGLMLVPALVPLCLGDSPAREITTSGSMALALAAVAVHTAAMLVTTGVIATGVCRGVAMHARLLSGAAASHAWTAALAVTGVLLMALR